MHLFVNHVNKIRPYIKVAMTMKGFVGQVINLIVDVHPKKNITYKSSRIKTSNMLLEAQLFLFIMYFLKGRA